MPKMLNVLDIHAHSPTEIFPKEIFSHMGHWSRMGTCFFNSTKDEIK